MGTAISLGFAAFVCSASFLCSALAASPEQEFKPGNGTAVVSVDLLRHPITAGVRKELLSALDQSIPAIIRPPSRSYRKCSRNTPIRPPTSTICSVSNKLRPIDLRLR